MSKYQTACAQFTFKNSVSKGKFIDFCNGEKGLNVTRGWEGCHSVECYDRDGDDNIVTIWQKWESKEHHQSYVKYRHEQGDFDFLHTLISSEPDIFYLEPVNFTDRDSIKSIIKDMCDTDWKKGRRHMSDDCVFIRPSGNPLNMEGWEKMMSNPNVNVESSKLLDIQRLSVSGDDAFACYTSHSKFSYMGKENDDIAVFSSVFHKDKGVWKVVHGQRSSGRKPCDEQPKFD